MLKILSSIMEFVPLLQTAAYIASIAAIVPVFIAAQSAYLNVQEPRRRRRLYKSFEELIFYIIFTHLIYLARYFEILSFFHLAIIWLLFIMI